MSANSDWKAVMQAMTKQIVFCLLVLVCVSAASGQGRNAPNSAKAFAEKKFSTTYEDYREKGDNFQFHHWVGYFNDREKRPVIVWLHGGALMMGISNTPPQRLRDLAQSEGYVIVGVHYRNYPFRKVPGIIEDVKQCFAWIRAKGPELFGADPDRMVVSGSSAGGYLTMMCGLVIDPKPAGLVPYWGYGDVDGDWYVKPHYLNRPRVKLEECTRPDGRFDAAKSYLYFRQNGLWTSKVTGFDPATERDKLTPYCPVRMVTPSYPPTFMIHGTADNDVPYQRSVDMQAKLQKNKVWNHLVTVKGGGHGCRGHEELLLNAHPFINYHLSGGESESGYNVLRIDLGEKHFDVLTEAHRDAATRAQAMTLHARRLNAYRQAKANWEKRFPNGTYQPPPPPEPKFRIVSGNIPSLDAAYRQLSLPDNASGKP